MFLKEESEIEEDKPETEGPASVPDSAPATDQPDNKEMEEAAATAAFTETADDGVEKGNVLFNVTLHCKGNCIHI